jgi:pilus assembly protein CpaE
MPIYFFAAGNDSAEPNELENRLRNAIPELIRVGSIEQLILGLPKKKSPSEMPEMAYVVFPFPREIHASIEKTESIASQYRETLFFIFVSDDISASDYKRLIRTGCADWVSTGGAAQEILDIIARRGAKATASSRRTRAAIASFVPSAGGVGNATIAMEAAVQMKTNKATRDRAICLIDLDFQTSHVCDLLDLEPRMQIEEFARQPERLDAQLFELFISRHSTGLDVLAAPKNKSLPNELSITALDALFGMISSRYDLVLIDLPVIWLNWTPQVLCVSDTAIATGLITIPSLRQVSDTLRAIRNLDHVPPRIVVALNRCHRRFLRGVAGMQYVKRILRDEDVFYVCEDTAAVQQSVNTGIPIAVTNPRGRISKDVAQLTSILPGLKAAQNSAA